MTKISTANVAEAIATFEANIDDRLSYEKSNSDNILSITKNFNTKVRKRANAATLTFFLKQKIDLNFMNKHNIQTKRMNVYACEKVCKLVDHINIDEYSRAIFKAARKLQENDSYLTREDAKHVCCTNHDTVKGERAALLADCRIQKLKSASTVSTQHSSSLHAMQTAHMLTVSRDDANNEIFVLDADNAHVKKLIAAIDKQDAA
ncbi:MAG: hypothetical protein JJ979_11985 [Roseibium sp.]|nr:hypothetical protein [Roseibium sp.]